MFFFLNIFYNSFPYYKLFNLCEKLGVGVWIENPDTSWWWRQKNFCAYRSPDSPDICRLCFCRFGTPWKKPTRICTNLPLLRGLRVWCHCSNNHQQLRGNSTLHKKPWSLVAQPYPRGVSFLLASAACVFSGWSGSVRLLIPETARAGCFRIGEAKKPGPRRVRSRSAVDISQVQLLSNNTLALESRALEKFLSWTRGRI